MRITKLQLVNYCQHADLTVTFVNGLNGIVGANGSGKSNLMGAVYFALTNDNPNAGKKQENIRAGTPEESHAYVQMEFEHNGATGVVTRYLRTGYKSKLLLSGHPTIDGDTNVTNTLMDMLGVDVATLRQLVVVSQDSLYGVLSESAAVRTKLYQRLFQIERAEKLYSMLRDEVLKNKADDAAPDDNSAQELQAAKAMLDAAKADCAKYEPQQVYMAGRDAAVAEIARLRAALGNVTAIKQSKQLLLTAESNYNRLILGLPDLRQAFTDAAAAQEQANAAHKEAEVQRGLFTAQSSNRAVRKSLEDQIKVLSAERDSIVAPPSAEFFVESPGLPPVRLDDSNINSFIQACTTLQGNIGNLQLLLKNMTGQAHGACPLCKTPAELIVSTRKAIEDELAVYTAAFPSLQATIHAYQHHSAQAQRAATRQVELANQTAKAQADLERYPVGEDIEFSLDTYNQIVSAAIASGQRYVSTQQALSTAELQVQQLGTEIAGHKSVLGAAQQFDLDFDYATAIAAQEQVLSKYTQLLQARAGADDAVYLATIKYKQAETAADFAKTAQAQRLKIAQVHEHFKQLAAVYHYDAAPKDLTQRNLELCQSRLNSVLVEFGAKFSVLVRDDLSFDCIFPDKVQPAHRLSCGQRVVLALCLRIALVTALLPEVGLLMLDEPTTFLDADTIKAFNSALSKLREFATASDIQVVIVTHCTDLIPAFDGVIQL
jgi:DNA repair exonuclease SbcCD ATPase subunit